MNFDFLKGSVQFVKGVGPRRADVLKEAGVVSVRDLFRYYPRRYLDRTSVTRVRDIRSGMDSVTIVGTVRATGIIPGRKKSRFEMTLMDEWGGSIKCIWFQGANWVSKVFETGQKVAVHGKPQKYGGQFSLSHPEFDRLEEEGPALDTGRIIALYPGGASLERVGLTSRLFRRIEFGLFKDNGTQLGEMLPEWLVAKYALMEGRVALRAVHFPKDDDELTKARHRLKFEELFFIQLMMAMLRRERVATPGIPFENRKGLSSRFLEDVLPFKLTRSQQAAIADIRVDTGSGNQMNRLLQGDVGSGKTVVAVAALLRAVENGCQGAFMAPTEILAEQHYRNLCSYLEPLGVSVRLLLGGMKKSVRDEIRRDLANGSLPIVVGTHAVIQKDVDFRKLGLCVVDEQHRFGVRQRATLLEKGHRPHMLLMTATPIPRSLAMTVYGDLEVSVMRDRPPGRMPVRTMMLWDKRRDEAYDLIRSEIEKGHQCYIIYPLVEESEKLDLKDAESGYDRVCEAFPGVPVGLVHGRMKGVEKDEAMSAFVSGETRILVSTTVIEVGVDVPNASVMMIEHAERFGLSQLHQLRGRIGRGTAQSTCILMADFKRSNEADVRLKTMVETDDGFKISEMDLKIRGAGDFFGTRQSGLPDLKIADIVEDQDILIEARRAAFELADSDPELAAPEHEMLARYFSAFYARDRFNLSRVG